MANARTRHAYDGAVSREPAGWDADSPLQAEIHVVWLDGDQVTRTGRHRPPPWLLQLGPTERPVGVVDRVGPDVGRPTLVRRALAGTPDAEPARPDAGAG